MNLIMSSWMPFYYSSREDKQGSEACILKSQS